MAFMILTAAVVVVLCSGAAAAQSAPVLPCGSAASLCHDVRLSQATETGKSAAMMLDPPPNLVGNKARQDEERNEMVDAPAPQFSPASSSQRLAIETAFPASLLQAEGVSASGHQAKDDGSGADAGGVERPHQTASKKHPTGKHASSATSGSADHIFWVIPAYKVNYSGDFKPLTSREKFQEWAQSAYDPLGLATTAVEAGTLERSSTDGFCGYGPAFTDYLKCFGSLELDSNDSSFLGDYVLTVWWHQDPRYFRLGKGSFGKRTLYAISRVFITYNDSGKNVVYSSGLAGTGIAAVVSNLYYPQSERTVGHTFSRVGIDLSDTALYNGAAEFWPGIHAWVDRVF